MNAAILAGLLIWAAGTLGASLPQPQPQPQPQVQPPPQAPEPTAAEQLLEEAQNLKSLVTSRLAWSFLDMTKILTNPETRTLYRSADRKTALTEEQMLALPEDKRVGFTKRDCNARFYYYTGYGTPLMYARALDLLAQKDPDTWAPDKLPGKRIADFGYGTIGHLKLLASMGAEVTGIDVDPLLGALYSFPGDQGEVAGDAGIKGKVRVLCGRWPAEEEIVKAVKEGGEGGEGGAYDLFMSKNTLKRGYIHPARQTEERFLVKLGVEDEAYLKAVYDSLKPGGVFLIYNLSPAQNPADKPYLPHADGQCPFPREQLEKAGFEVLEFDHDDQEGIVKFWMKLGYNEGKSEELTKQELFAWWTMCRKPADRPRSDSGSRPDSRRSFVTDFNAKISQLADGERAWPTYREARLAFEDLPEALREKPALVLPKDDAWGSLVEYIERNRDAIDLIKRGAAIAQLGAPLSDQPDPVLEAALAKRRGETFEPRPAAPDVAMIDLNIYTFAPLRLFARVTAWDALVAASRSDVARAQRDLLTLDKLSAHVAQAPALISTLVQMSIQGQLLDVIGHILAQWPERMPEEQLAVLAHIVAAMDPIGALDRAIDSEREFFEDVMRRAFADDGSGEQKLTADGWALLLRISDQDKPADGRSAPPPRPEMAGRSEIEAEYERIADNLRNQIRLPMHEWMHVPYADVQLRMSQGYYSPRLAPIEIMSPAWSKAAMGAQQLQARRDATRVAIALRRMERATGRLPDSLAGLMPAFLDAIPLDPYDAKPLKYQLTGKEAVLYSVGADRDDDHGRAISDNPSAAMNWRSAAEVKSFNRGDKRNKPVPDGDWVLWPAIVDPQKR